MALNKCPVSGNYYSYYYPKVGVDYSGLSWIGPKVLNDNKSKWESPLKLKERRGNYSFSYQLRVQKHSYIENLGNLKLTTLGFYSCLGTPTPTNIVSFSSVLDTCIQVT